MKYGNDFHTHNFFDLRRKMKEHPFVNFLHDLYLIGQISECDTSLFFRIGIASYMISRQKGLAV